VGAERIWWRACARAGLPRRFAPRNDVRGASRIRSSIVKQPDACLQTRVIAPVLISARGSPSYSNSFSPSGRAERWAKGRARGARMVCMRAPRMTSFWQRHTGDPRAVREKRHTGGPTQRRECDEPDRHGSKLSPAFRTRMDLSACWMSQGWPLVPTSPRSCELSPGHSLEPSAWVTGVCAPPAALDAWSPMSARTFASRRRAPKTTGARPEVEREDNQIFLPRDKVKDFIPACGLL
jgi:hypothetical protein